MLRTRPNSSSVSSTAKNDGCLNKNIGSTIAKLAKIMAEIEIMSSSSHMKYLFYEAVNLT